MKTPDPLEKDIEKAVCSYATERKILNYKFTSMGRRSIPDRLFILPGARGCFFVEFKRLGQKPTPAQEVEIAKIRAQGVSVFVIDSVADGKQVIDGLLDSDL